MKQVLLGMIVLFTAGTLSVSAQQDTKVKSKPTSTVPQKVHNTVSKHKKHNGHKTKVKHAHKKSVTTVKHD
jgi:hypothetical protein